MGKMRFKLSHVMPHAWFYKLREVGKPAQFKNSDTPRKLIYASPINHKVIDIPYPAETPTKRSPHIEPLPENSPGSDQLHLFELSDECRPSIVLPYAPSQEDIMNLSFEEDNRHRISSAPDNDAGPPSSGLTLDVRELERRLKALDWEERRKYHTSPMLLSVCVPSPMMDCALHTGTELSHGGDKELDRHSLEACGAQAASASVAIADGFSVDISGAIAGKSASMNVAYGDDERPSEVCVSNGEGLCGSIDESNRRSTSSSDTGLERGSSSMWERDVFSITSDGSEAFTTVGADEMEPIAHNARRRFWKLRERMSPSLYGNLHMEGSMSRVYDDNCESRVAKDDIMSTFFKNTHAAGGLQSAQRRVLHATYNLGEGSHEKGGGPPPLYVRDGTTRFGDVGRSKRSSHYMDERLFSPRKGMDSHRGKRAGTSFSSGRKHEIAIHQSMPSLPDYDDKVDSFSLPDDRNDSLAVQDDSGDDDRQSVHSRMSAGRFSYAKCKERLLSSRNVGMRLQEEENLSNYAKFKLKQRGLLQSKVSPSNVDMYLDPGLFNSVLRKDLHVHGHENTNTPREDVSIDTSRFDQGNEYVLSRRQSTSSYQSKSPHVRVKGPMTSKSNIQEPGPSYFKGTLRAVREKTRDSSFEQFSPSPSAAGTPLSVSRSRVFDSFAMVKCSYDPRHDFKDSMVEMIREKGLHSSHDMVELLQCYLTLNPDVYHDTIVKVFTEVWSEMFRHI